ncbi:hypothetical protein [Clostridium botulinum]|uniref:hypothetical protein n=1 Tax=Clostridium botulinum TaxID=1491 RepID=UPI001C9B81C5|nr:hypothetical protein [Clostridium botulinum]MBY6838860.1 hypothetical protein [Clostridium botulinum]
MKKSMTIFYKKIDNEMLRVCQGQQTLSAIGNLTEKEAELIWGYFYIDFDQYIFDHLEEFQLDIKDEKFLISMKEESKNKIKKYL